MASLVPVNPLSQTVSFQRFLSEPGVVSRGEVRRMRPFGVMHMMNVIYQGTQLLQGTLVRVHWVFYMSKDILEINLLLLF